MPEHRAIRLPSWRRFRRVIYINGGPYLVRYRLISTPWFGVYLHHILRSDQDQEKHDHPWSFFSWVLWGSYREFLADEDYRTRCVHRRWLSFAKRTCDQFHRVELDRPVWTLILVGPKTKEWGFLVDGKQLPWREYIMRKGRKSNGAIRED